MLKMTIIVGLCIFVSFYFVSCERQVFRFVPKTLERDEYNIPIVEDSMFNYSIPHLKCLGGLLKYNLTYIQMISDCYSDPETIAYVKNKSKSYLIKGKAKEEQTELLRCLGTLTVTEKYDYFKKYVEVVFHECMEKYKIEKYIEEYVKDKFRSTVRHQFRELLLCLADTDSEELANKVQSTDCIQTNPVLIQIGELFRNPFPQNVIPPKKALLKSGGKLMSESYISTSHNEEETFPEIYYVDYEYYE